MNAPEANVQEVIESLHSSEYVLTHGPISPGPVVVMYQEQLRTISNPPCAHWSKWCECDEKQYKRNKETPIRYGWEYRARKLFVEPEENYQ